MDKKPCAVVFLFTGCEPNKEVIERIGARLTAGCKPITPVEAYVFGSKDLAQAIIGISKEQKKDDSMNAQSQFTAEDEAVILIGTELRESLGSGYTPDRFLASLMARIEMARINPDTELNKSFMNALFILSREDLVLSKALLKKYHLDESKIMLIKRVYNFISRY